MIELEVFKRRLKASLEKTGTTPVFIEFLRDEKKRFEERLEFLNAKIENEITYNILQERKLALQIIEKENSIFVPGEYKKMIREEISQIDKQLEGLEKRDDMYTLERDAVIENLAIVSEILIFFGWD